MADVAIVLGEERRLPEMLVAGALHAEVVHVIADGDERSGPTSQAELDMTMQVVSWLTSIFVDIAHGRTELRRDTQRDELVAGLIEYCGSFDGPGGSV